jgi:hypothetical protein
MLRDFFESLKDELMGIFPHVMVGIPHTSKEDPSNPANDVTDSDDNLIIYITFINIEKIEQIGLQSSIATIRVLFTAFLKDKDLQDEEKQLMALDAIDEIILYLNENKKKYNLVATPENVTNNIWSSFRIPLRPFLLYECPVNLNR